MGFEKAKAILVLADLDSGDFNYRDKGEVNLLKSQFQILFGFGFKLDEGFFHVSVQLRRTTITRFQITSLIPVLSKTLVVPTMQVSLLSWI